jgi:hypothetical protein
MKNVTKLNLSTLIPLGPWLLNKRNTLKKKARKCIRRQKKFGQRGN